MKRTWQWWGLGLGLLAACGSDSSGGDGGDPIASGRLEFLAGYCASTLLADTALEVWTPSDAGWSSTSTQTLAAGTPVVVDAFRDEAYAFTSAGKLRRLTLPDGSDFTAGKQISADCDVFSNRRSVFLEPATLRAGADGTGASCAVAAGEGFEGVSSQITPGQSVFDGEAIKARCGFSPAYGEFVHRASLNAVDGATSLGPLEVGPAGFLGAWCQGTTARDLDLEVTRPASQAGAWTGGLIYTIPAGTALAVGGSLDELYALGVDGGLRRLQTLDHQPLALGADITSDCAANADHLVVFEPVTLHASEGGTGASCELAAGEGLPTPGLTYSISVGEARLDGAAVSARCGFSPAYGTIGHEGTLAAANGG